MSIVNTSSTPNVVDFASDPPAIWRMFSEISGDIGFDIGANGGMTSRLLAPRFGQIVAFEPANESYQHLCSETPENVIPVLAAVSNHSGEVELEERDKCIGMGELTTAGAGLGDASSGGPWGQVVGTRVVRCVTLDDMAAEYGDPDFVKIDTEGHEQAVIEGGLATIERANPRMLIEVHDAAQGAWILDALGGAFEMVRHPYYNPGGHKYQNHYWLLRGL